MSAELCHDDVQISRVRSMTYSFLAAALRYPDSDAVQELADPGCLAAWKYGVATRCPSLLPLAEDIAARVLQCAGDPAVLEQVKHAYIDLFGHAVRGTCPPYEIEYGHAEVIQQASELADIRGFYHAFGLDLAGQAHERVDHAGAQCEFMSALAARLVRAAQESDGEGEYVLLQAQASFLGAHIGCWFPAFCGRLEASDPGGFYGAVGALAREFIRLECARFDVTCGPAYLDLRPADPAGDAAIECGVEPGCPGAAPAGQDQLVQIGIGCCKL